MKLMVNDELIKQIRYACPKCKHPLRSVDNTLYCNKCEQTYPIISGIPDFILEDSQASLTPVRSMAKKMDFLAPFYEHLLWQGKPFLKLIGSDVKSADSMINFHAEILKGITGFVLDVACGTATYTRRIASSGRVMYGIDISMGMLRQGMTYITQNGVSGICLARARVEELPFEDAVFDGIVCAGSLHLFPDVSLALREIVRTMKPGALLTAQTLLAGNTIINRWIGKLKEVHAFELPELQRYVTEVGLEKFQPTLDGIILVFSARKAAART